MVVTFLFWFFLYQEKGHMPGFFYRVIICKNLGPYWDTPRLIYNAAPYLVAMHSI